MAQGSPNTLYYARKYLAEGTGIVENSPSPDMAGYALPATLCPYAEGDAVPEPLEKCLGICDKYLLKAEKDSSHHSSKSSKVWGIRSEALLRMGRMPEAILSARTWKDRYPLEGAAGDYLMAAVWVAEGRSSLALTYLVDAPEPLRRWLEAYRAAEYGHYVEAARKLEGVEVPPTFQLSLLRMRLYLARVTGDSESVYTLATHLRRLTPIEKERHMLTLDLKYRSKRPSDELSGTISDGYELWKILQGHGDILSARLLLTYLLQTTPDVWHPMAYDYLEEVFIRRQLPLELNILYQTAYFTSRPDPGEKRATLLAAIEQLHKELEVIESYETMEDFRSKDRRTQQRLLSRISGQLPNVHQPKSTSTADTEEHTSFFEKWGNVPNEDYWTLSRGSSGMGLKPSEQSATSFKLPGVGREWYRSTSISQEEYRKALQRVLDHRESHSILSEWRQSYKEKLQGRGSEPMPR